MRPLKNRLKTAQILLEKPFKNLRKKWAVFERFLSKIWAVWAVFPKNRLNPPNRSNLSNLAEKPLKPLISWTVFERDLDPGGLSFYLFIFENLNLQLSYLRLHQNFMMRMCGNINVGVGDKS